MKKNILIPLVFGFTCVFAQEKLISDGFNLASLCNDPCYYMSFQEPIYFPLEEDKEWQIVNMEMGLKPSGAYLATGDLNIVGADTAAILQLELWFFDEDGKKIHVDKADSFEFFNDPGHAEPIVFSGQIPKEVTPKVKFIDIGIKSSERVPYYTISSNCFQPCKKLQLKDAMKAYKKKK